MLASARQGQRIKYLAPKTGWGGPAAGVLAVRHDPQGVVPRAAPVRPRASCARA
jgi:hypothetical protein